MDVIKNLALEGGEDEGAEGVRGCVAKEGEGVGEGGGGDGEGCVGGEGWNGRASLLGLGNCFIGQWERE